jgi:hypothetical protein
LPLEFSLDQPLLISCWIVGGLFAVDISPDGINFPNFFRNLQQCLRNTLGVGICDCLGPGLNQPWTALPRWSKESRTGPTIDGSVREQNFIVYDEVRVGA